MRNHTCHLDLHQRFHYVTITIGPGMWKTLPKQCRLGLFQDSDFAGDLEDSKSTSRGTLYIFRKSYICSNKLDVQETNFSFAQFKKDQKSFLCAGLRLDGIPALDLWDLIVLILGNIIQTNDGTGQPVVKCDKDHGPNKRSQGMINVLNNIDCVPSNVHFSHQEALLHVFEDNGAVIKMIITRKSPTMRHVSRTHRVALDWLFDRINLDSEIQIKYIDTKNQLADMLTKGNFTRDEWNHLLCLFNISHLSSTVFSETMAKRLQQDSGEERVTAKSRPQTIYGKALSQHATQSGMITKLGLLKSGKLTHRWVIERSNPL